MIDDSVNHDSKKASARLKIMKNLGLDHFTVVCSVTWPLKVCDLVLMQTCFCRVNQFVLLTNLHLNEKVSVAFIGQVTEHTTAKCQVRFDGMSGF